MAMQNRKQTSHVWAAGQQSTRPDLSLRSSDPRGNPGREPNSCSRLLKRPSKLDSSLFYAKKNSSLPRIANRGDDHDFWFRRGPIHFTAHANKTETSTCWDTHKPGRCSAAPQFKGTHIRRDACPCLYIRSAMKDINGTGNVGWWVQIPKRILRRILKQSIGQLLRRRFPSYVTS